MLYTARMTPTETTLQGDRATWERLVAALGRNTREALAIRGALGATPAAPAVRLTLPRETATRLLEVDRQVPG
jgi:hypothetical protein